MFQNITVSGLPASEAVIGDKWALGSVLLQVAQPPPPCNLSLRATRRENAMHRRGRPSLVSPSATSQATARHRPREDAGVKQAARARPDCPQDR
jgi:hypothetical protein